MANNFDLITEAVNKFIVTPLNAFGLGGFVFDIEGDTTMNLSTDITDHYLEDNRTVQDHIAVRPKRVILKSYVGELVYREDTQSNTPVQQVVRKLTTVSQFLPTLSQAATQAKEFIDSKRASTLSLGDITLESVNKTLDYWSAVKNIAGAIGNNQQAAYQYFKALMEQKILTSVQTPYEFLPNMAIESIVAIQSEKSRYISDFSITLKQIRMVQELGSIPSDNIPTTAPTQAALQSSATSQDNFTAQNFNVPAYQGRSGPQRLSLQNLGNMEGLTVEKTVGGNVKAIADVFKSMGVQPVDLRAVP